MADLEKANNALSPTATVTGDATPPTKKEGSVDDKGTPTDVALDDSAFPKGAKLFLLLFALMVNVVIVSLDQTIIAPAVAVISNEFNSLADIGWYTSAYLMTTTALQPMYARLYGIFPLKWTYLSTIAIFEIGSLICALAKDSKTFIIGRAIAGSGLAGGYIGTLLIIAVSAPVQAQATYTGFIGMAYGAGAVAGPLIGGAFTSKVTWRWCFWLNLPIGGVTVILALLFLHPPHRPRTRSLATELKNLDFIGTGLLLGGIISFLLICQWGGLEYEWGSSTIIGLLVGFPLIFAAWFAWEAYRKEDAAIVLRLFKNRTIFFGAIANFMTGAAYFSILTFISVWFQSAQGSSAIRAGVQTLPFISGAIAATIAAGVTTTIFGFYNVQLLAGFAIGTIGSGLLYTMDAGTGQAKWVAYQFLVGVGFGAAFQLPFIASQTEYSGWDRERGSSIVIFSQTLGGCLLASASQAAYSNKYIGALIDIPGIDPFRVFSSGATGFREFVPAGPTFDAIVSAAVDSIKWTFIIGAAVGSVGFIAALFLPWNDVREHDVKVGGA